MASSSCVFPPIPFSASSSLSHRRSDKEISGLRWNRGLGLRIPISLKSNDCSSSRVRSYGHSYASSSSKTSVVDSGEDTKPPDEALKVSGSSERDVSTSIWNWRGYRIRYQSSGKVGPALILIHGFGANRGCWPSGSHYGASNLQRNTVVGKLFYTAVATKESVKSILCQCYHDKSAVTDELVQIILQPGLDSGAADVFLEFICYSDGPLPEELLPKVKCPVLVAWGDKDPWEPIELGKAYADFEAVEDFVVLPNVGHCPQDEAPDLVNPLIRSFVERHSVAMDGGSP